MAICCLSERTKKLLTFIAGFIMLLPNGVTWFWGNLSIYVYSYFYHKNKTEHHDVKAPWLLSLYVISWSTAMMVSGHVNNKIGRRLTLVLGMALFDGGLVGSYFVFSKSLTLLDLTMGLFCGFGNGLLHAMVLQTIVEWTSSRVGLATAYLLASYAVGSTITNQLVTHYLNPENKKVNVVIDGKHYFSQKDILDKVPSIFLALSTCSGALHITAFLLFRIRHIPEVVTAQKKQHGATRRKENISCLSKKSVAISCPHIEEKDKIHDDSSYWYEQMNNPCEGLQDDKTSLEDDCTSHQTSTDKSPSQMLKTTIFYVLWLTVFGSDSAYITLSNYYKIFGQIWIKDDHFLTNLGTVLATVTVLIRLLWGLLSDVFGVKPAFVTLTSGLALITTGYFFTAHLNKWLFFVTTILYGCLNCGIYINFIVAAHTFYGRTHFTNNCGLMASATIVLNLTFPPASQFLLSHFGWFALFFTVGALNLCSLILIVCFLPE